VPSDLSHTAARRSLVVVPFLDEDSELVLRTLAIAAAHPRVAEVVGVSGSQLLTNQQVEKAAPSLEGAPVRIISQERIGNRRPGKGDAVNTGFRHFLEETSFDRIHFYDADIRTFSERWVEKAEVAADRGFEAVRHYYPRAATDAMITWMVTRPGLALLWPQSELPWIAQPLSGELLFARSAAEVLANDPMVRAQSDWGIDTIITAATVHHGLSIYECYISEGKDHSLYGPLTDIRVMMVECLSALQTLRESVQPQPVIHRIEYPHAVAPSITEKLAYDIEATQQLLAEDWTPRQEQLLEAHFLPSVVAGAKKWKRWPDTSFLDEETWLSTLSTLMDRFVLSDEDWASIAFRLWLGRVLQYTLTIAVRGHAHSLAYLNNTVLRAAHRR
jgi:mannosylglycerate synthase